MMKGKKSRFWTFWLSFMPGCAEMYMGFMKMGLSLMVAFWGIIALATVLEMGPIVFMALIVWFYGFFHARNMAHMNDNEFEKMEDEYLYHIENFGVIGIKLTKNYRRLTAAVLILFGGMLLVRNILYMLSAIIPEEIYRMLNRFYSYLPQTLIGIVIIAIGVHMIKGRKQELLEEKDGE